MSPPTPSIWLRTGIAILCAVLMSLLLFSWINHLEMAEKAKEANQTWVSLALSFLLPGWLSWPFSLGSSIGSWINSALFFCARLIAFWLVVRLSWPLSGPITRWLIRWKSTKSVTATDSPAGSTNTLQKVIPISGGIFKKLIQGNGMPIQSFVPSIPKEYPSMMNANSLTAHEIATPETPQVPTMPEPKLNINQQIIESCFAIERVLMDMLSQDGREHLSSWKLIHDQVKKICVAYPECGTCNLNDMSIHLMEQTVSRLTYIGAMGVQHAALLRQLLRQ